MAGEEPQRPPPPKHEPDRSDHYAKLICTYRAPTVLSGLVADPENWFMSAADHPTEQ